MSARPENASESNPQLHVIGKVKTAHTNGVFLCTLSSQIGRRFNYM